MNYPISVVVPTKNRYKYLKKLVELITGFNTEELELVIQDNSDCNQEILEFLSAYDYPWIKYYYCDKHLTSIENFDLAINNTTGDYVCFIGDDDGVVRNIVDCAKWMKANNIEALRPATSTYEWPECGRNGYYTIDGSFKMMEYLNPVKELVKILKNGCLTLGNIPVVYTGIVKREILQAIYNDHKTFFPGGASADVANGVALSIYVKRYVKLNIPITITGTSKTTGGVSKRRKFIPFSDLPFISPIVGPNWEGDYPKYWFGDFVWPESATKSLRALGKESFITFFNLNVVFAHAIIKAKCSPSEYYAFCSPLTLYVNLLKVYTKEIVMKVLRRLRWWILSILRKKKYSGRGYSDIISVEIELLDHSVDFNKLDYK